MRAIVSIVMSLVFLFQGISVNMETCEQIEKIANTIAHYQEHKQYDGDSFLDFVLKEYVNNDGSAEGHHKNSNHHETPLSHSHQCVHIAYLISFQSPYFLEDSDYRKNARFDNYNAFFSPTYIDSLFQPPRV